MFWQIIGWVVMALVLFKGSIVYLILMANGMGKYNIGGVPNSNFGKGLYLIGGVVVLGLWYALFKYAPFSISFKF